MYRYASKSNSFLQPDRAVDPSAFLAEFHLAVAVQLLLRQCAHYAGSTADIQNAPESGAAALLAEVPDVRPVRFLQKAVPTARIAGHLQHPVAASGRGKCLRVLDQQGGLVDLITPDGERAKFPIRPDGVRRGKLLCGIHWIFPPF